jgi:hypothetical protein
MASLRARGSVGSRPGRCGPARFARGARREPRQRAAGALGPWRGGRPRRRPRRARRGARPRPRQATERRGAGPAPDAAEDAAPLAPRVHRRRERLLDGLPLLRRDERRAAAEARELGRLRVGLAARARGGEGSMRAAAVPGGAGRRARAGQRTLGRVAPCQRLTAGSHTHSTRMGALQHPLRREPHPLERASLCQAFPAPTQTRVAKPAPEPPRARRTLALSSSTCCCSCSAVRLVSQLRSSAAGRGGGGGGGGGGGRGGGGGAQEVKGEQRASGSRPRPQRGSAPLASRAHSTPHPLHGPHPPL